MELPVQRNVDRGVLPPQMPNKQSRSEAEGQPSSAEPPPAPKFLLWIGLVSLLLGVGVGFVNHFVVGLGLNTLARWDFGEQAPRLLWWNIPLGYLMGGSLAVCGLAMMLRLRVSRKLAFLNLSIAFFATGMAFVLIVGVSAVGTAHSLKNPAYGPYETTQEVRVPSLFTPYIWPAAIALATLMSTTPIRAWVKRRPLSAETAEPGSSTSGLAIMSLVASLMPCLLVTPLIGFLSGWVALRAIDRSNGAKSGRWFAICGIVLSVAALFSLAGMGVGLGVIAAEVQSSEFNWGDESSAQERSLQDDVQPSEHTIDPSGSDSTFFHEESNEAD